MLDGGKWTQSELPMIRTTTRGTLGPEVHIRGPKGGSSGPPSCLWRKGALLLTLSREAPKRLFQGWWHFSPTPDSLVQLEVAGVPFGGLIRGGLLLLFPDMVFPVIIHKPHLLQEAS